MEKIYIRNTIGWHVTNEDFSEVFQNAIKKEKEEKDDDDPPEVHIHINSPGGSVWMGWDIFNEIRHAVSEGVLINTYNNGLAASMGWFVFLAADKDRRYASENSLGMIHNPSGFSFGDEEKMRKEADLLEKIGDIMSSYFSKDTKKEKDYMKALMSRTTWFNPDEMIEEGFLKKGNVVDGGKPVEPVNIVGMDKSNFSNMPNNLEKILCFSEKLPTSEDEKFREDLTIIHNSKIRERTWKNYIKS